MIRKADKIIKYSQRFSYFFKVYKILGRFFCFRCFLLDMTPLSSGAPGKEKLSSFFFMNSINFLFVFLIFFFKYIKSLKLLEFMCLKCVLTLGMGLNTFIILFAGDGIRKILNFSCLVGNLKKKRRGIRFMTSSNLNCQYMNWKHF